MGHPPPPPPRPPRYLGHLKWDVLARKLVYSRPVLLGGANSSHPVRPDPGVSALIKSMAAPVRALERKEAGERGGRARGRASGCRRPAAPERPGSCPWDVQMWQAPSCAAAHTPPMSKARRRRKPILTPPPGLLAVELDADIGRQVESPYGDLMADLLVSNARQLTALVAKYGPIDISIFPAGGIRNGLKVGAPEGAPLARLRPRWLPLRLG